MSNHDKIIPEADSYRAYLTKATCWCSASLRNEPIRGYPHPSGWRVIDHKEKQWLYIKCPSCGHDWALWKLGVARY